MNEVIAIILPLLTIGFTGLLHLTFGGAGDSLKHSLWRVVLTIVPWFLLLIALFKVYKHDNLLVDERVLISDIIMSMIVASIGGAFFALFSKAEHCTKYFKDIHLTLGTIYIFYLGCVYMVGLTELGVGYILDI